MVIVQEAEADSVPKTELVPDLEVPGLAVLWAVVLVPAVQGLLWAAGIAPEIRDRLWAGRFLYLPPADGEGLAAAVGPVWFP